MRPSKIRRRCLVAPQALGILLLAPGADAGTPSPDWVWLSERSVAVVSATVAESARRVERPDRRGPIQQILADGRLVVHMPSVHDYLVGSLVPFTVESVAKSDGTLAPGGAIGVFQGSPFRPFEPGEKYLLFLSRPLPLIGAGDAVEGWRTLEGTVLTSPGSTEEVPFDPLAAYGVSPSPEISAANGILKITPGNEAEVDAILELVHARAAPQVGWVGPVAGAWIRGDVTLSARATDDVAVLGVQFQLDGASLGNEVAPQGSAIFEATWSSRGSPDGPHHLAAVARDAAGTTAASERVEVVVDNTAPALTLAAQPAALPRFRRGRLVRVRLAVTVADALTPSPLVKLASIECGQTCRPETDIQGAEYGADDREFFLRTAGTGSPTLPAYTITYSASDAAGNEATTSTTVSVVPSSTRGTTVSGASPK